MEKITKKKFKETLCQYKTAFLGVSKQMATDKDIEEAYTKLLEIADTDMVKLRTATPTSKGVQFSDLSYLDICGENVDCYTAAGGNMLVLKQTWYDIMAEEEYYKVLYYAIP